MLLTSAVLIGFLALDAPRPAPQPFSGTNRQVIEKAVRESFQVRPQARQTLILVVRPQPCAIPLRNLLRPGLNLDPAIAIPAPARIGRMPNIMPAPPCPERP
jgi:hypothetical protein